MQSGRSVVPGPRSPIRYLFFLLDFPSVFPGFSQALRPLRRLFNCGTHLGALISFTWLLRCCCWPYHDLLRPIQEAVLLLPYHLSPLWRPVPPCQPPPTPLFRHVGVLKRATVGQHTQSHTASTHTLAAAHAGEHISDGHFKPLTREPGHQVQTVGNLP